MIDIHSHLLPGFDDGARSLEETLEMLAMAAADGTRQMIATPHMYAPPSFTKTSAEVHVAYDELRESLREASFDVKVLLGAENFISSEFLDNVRQRSVISLNGGPYILMEFGPRFVVDNLDYVVTLCRENRYIPILAHPERMHQFYGKVDLLEKLVTLGAVVQITGLSLRGLVSEWVTELTGQMAERDLIHFVASDAHGSTRRRPRLAEAYATAEAFYGPEKARKWFIDNPACVVRGVALEI
ncbi:MAG: tyrosine-protein phosphatase [Acidobacteriota bacterium]